jgi:hypothetical protein
MFLFLEPWRFPGPSAGLLKALQGACQFVKTAEICRFYHSFGVQVRDCTCQVLGKYTKDLAWSA